MMAAKKSDEAIKKAIKQAAAVAQQMYEQYRTDVAPWRTTGQEATNKLWEMVQAGPGEYEKSPYYDFLMEEGTGALERGAASKGKQFSGQQAKALTEYGQNLASTDYDNWLNRWYQSLTPYQNISSMGLTAATGSGQAAMQTGNTLGSLYLTRGASSAAKYQAQGQAINSGIQSTMNMLSSSMGGMGGGSGMGGF